MEQELVLLICDLVDSTGLAARMGDAEFAALSMEHDRIARELLERWEGREIDKSDGFLLTFASVSKALEWSLAYHQQLSQLVPAMAARVGIHRGVVLQEFGNEASIARGAKPVELHGLAKAITARIAALARSGQTLLSSAAATTVLQSELSLRSLGFWQLTGLAEPIGILVVVTADSEVLPPTDCHIGYSVLLVDGVWFPRREVRHSLPREHDRFVGRKTELRELVELFEKGARLVTIAGMGGVGKTRIAKHFARIWMGWYPGGIWFCDLTSASTLDGVLYAVAEGLDIRLDHESPTEKIARVLQGRGRCLLVLDNFEQVRAHASTTLGQWLNICSDTNFLVTSRADLNLMGEQIFRLNPLVPRDGQELFSLRSLAVGGGGDWAPGESAALSRLVEVLDGLPLAIELAAARTVVLPPSQILSRMSERFKMLSSRAGRPSRHVTLRATLDWSWGLLTDEQQGLLAQLSVFEGSFDFLAIEVITRLPSAEIHWLTDEVQSLVQQSLLGRVGDGRFRLLVSVKEYATERAALRKECMESSRRMAMSRHWEYYSSLNETRVTTSNGIDIDNMAMACRRAASAGEWSAMKGALLGVWWVLSVRGPYQAAINLAQELFALENLQDAALASIHYVAGAAYHKLGVPTRAGEELRCALDLAREVKDGSLECRILCILGLHETQGGKLREGLNLLQNASSLAARLDNSVLRIAAASALGSALSASGDADAAMAQFHEAFNWAEAVSDLRWQGGLMGNIGALHYLRGHFSAAKDMFLRSIDFIVRCGDKHWEANMRSNLGLLLQELGQVEDSRQQLSAALALSAELGHTSVECALRINIATGFDIQGDFRGAVKQYEDACKLASRCAARELEAHAFAAMGLAHAKLGQKTESEHSFAKSEQLLVECSSPTVQLILAANRVSACVFLSAFGSRFEAAKAEVETLLEQGSSWSPEALAAIKKMRTLVNC